MLHGNHWFMFLSAHIAFLLAKKAKSLRRSADGAHDLSCTCRRLSSLSRPRGGRYSEGIALLQRHDHLLI
jgi:hypothetical protein